MSLLLHLPDSNRYIDESSIIGIIEVGPGQVSWRHSDAIHHHLPPGVDLAWEPTTDGFPKILTESRSGHQYLHLRTRDPYLTGLYTGRDREVLLAWAEQSSAQSNANLARWVAKAKGVKEADNMAKTMGW